ncbi:hypothetical protein SDC9_139561 [bioreactor metagenome]|uniref:Uncharacterized protein n=1 Tax=bioreactor metagenome TaxID=1076179 RepID=A0A645DSW9_9ZZZZ
MDHLAPNMACSDDQNSQSWNDRLHVHLHLTTTNARVPFARVHQVVMQYFRLSFVQGIQCLCNDPVFDLAAANGALNVTIRIDQHFTAFMARSGTLGFNDRTKHDRLSFGLKFSDGLIDGHLYLQKTQDYRQ